MVSSNFILFKNPKIILYNIYFYVLDKTNFISWPKVNKSLFN